MSGFRVLGIAAKTKKSKLLKFHCHMSLGGDVMLSVAALISRSTSKGSFRRALDVR